MVIDILIFLILATFTLFVHIFGSKSQTGTFKFLVIFAVVTWLSGEYGSKLLGLADSWGASLARCDSPPYSKIYRNRLWKGVLFSVLVQSIFTIIFVASTVVYVKHAISRPNTNSWILWIAGFIIAMSPGTYAAGLSKLDKLMNMAMIQRNWNGGLQGFFCIICIFITPFLYLIFACSPKAMSYFSWLPFVD